MADRLAEGQSGLPDFADRQSTDEKIEAILDYLCRMDEQYRYILCQLQERP